MVRGVGGAGTSVRASAARVLAEPKLEGRRQAELHPMTRAAWVEEARAEAAHPGGSAGIPERERRGDCGRESGSVQVLVT